MSATRIHNVLNIFYVSIFLIILQTNAALSYSISSALSCSCSSLNSCSYSVVESGYEYMLGWCNGYACTESHVSKYCKSPCTLSCNKTSTNTDVCGCEEWKCDCPGGGGGGGQGGGDTVCYNTDGNGEGKGFSTTDPGNNCNCQNQYYDSGAQCCTSKKLYSSCGSNYIVSRTSLFPESLYDNNKQCSSSANWPWVNIRCATGYYITASIDYQMALGTSITVRNCSGCSTEKCYPKTPTECYKDGVTKCLTKDLDIDGDKSIAYNEKNIPFEWINCKQTDPTSCGYSSTDQFYTDFIAKNPDNTYKRQKFYVYSGNSCTIIWGDNSCAQPGYWLDASICALCPAGYHGDLDSLKYASCTRCGTGLSTFTDSNGDGKIEVSEHIVVTPDSSYCKKCPAGHMKTDDYCKPCENAGYYNSKTGQTSANSSTSICTEKCPIPFTTDITDVNDSINKCYIDSDSGNTAIKLTDSLGNIFLHEEISTNVKLYHQ